MKTFAAFTLIACACAGPVPAETPKPPPNDAAAVDAIKQVSQDMGDAMVAGDIGKLDRIYADDFATVGSSGALITKKTLLNDFESFHDKLVSFETGPIDVQVFGLVAVAQGSVREKRIRNGKDTSGSFAWMDLLENHGGTWVVVRSASARVAFGDAPVTESQDPTALEAIRKLEQYVGDAMVAFDVDTLDKTYADDWVTIGRSGEVFTKASLLGDFSSRKHKLVSFALGPMKVRVLGDVAMAQAGVTEKRFHDGKDVSGDFVFMDLLEKRAGNWVIVRTVGSRVSPG
jgi:ketosteroid isomerase-like protein